MDRFYEELDHTADWAIVVRGETLNTLFERVAQAMFELQGADVAEEPQFEEALTSQAVDQENLLVAWLSDLLFLSEVRDALFTRFHVEIQPRGDDLILTALVQGSPGRGSLAHIKAVTYYDLRVTRTAHGWEAQVTFDT